MWELGEEVERGRLQTTVLFVPKGLHLSATVLRRARIGFEYVTNSRVLCGGKCCFCCSYCRVEMVVRELGKAAKEGVA